MTNLRSINLDYNKLTTIPKEVAMIDSLECVEIDGNDLTNMPIEMFKFIDFVGEYETQLFSRMIKYAVVGVSAIFTGSMLYFAIKK